MTSKEVFFFLLLTLTLSQWIAYFKLREWWRFRHPEPLQGKPVDRVLWHTLSDTGTPWKAGDSWQNKGRGMTVAMIRQGLDEMLNELNVNDYAPIYQLGYAVREADEEAALNALNATIRRRDETIDRLTEELRRSQERSQPYQQPLQARSASPKKSDWSAACEEWARTPVGVVNLDDYRQAPISEGITAPEPENVEPTPESEEMQPVQRVWASIEERDDEILRLHVEESLSYDKLAKMFGFESRGGSQGACKRAKRRKEQQEATLLHPDQPEAAETTLLDGSNG